MAGAGGPQRLRDWLVAQIESGRYAGLRWEDAGKTLFRIPWKHAAQQGYQAQQDAALFRAWAIHKGRHLEGIDKEDPPTWKTRLRCALNKSADFCEVRERSQLDISDPYKVYRIVSGSAHGPVARTCAPPGKKNILRSRQEPPGDVTELVAHRTDQASCPASPCSLASSVTSALGALWHCHLSCPLLQLLPRHHPCLSCQLDLFLPLLHLYCHPQPHRPLPFASNVCGSTAGCIRPVSSKFTPRPCHHSCLCPHLHHLCPMSVTSVLIFITSVPISITSVLTSVTSVPSSLPPLSHVCHLCPHLYHVCPLISATSVPISITCPHLYPFCTHLCHLCPHLYHLCPLPAHSVLTCLSLAQ
ncbi:uncharacterized protein LOC121012335 isoform X2 [Herpailurus yagouaroundi]|uniref:uncharacterized protein LOC121012335 isoform X2 n=1 Tax=Herpailurus yagouaroundi TaxID=1608482 RepID=UPI001AD76EEC|nr:uncharacterized protein LOC121012335 isoform X2 [Puma yagouaroundi]